MPPENKETAKFCTSENTSKECFQGLNEVISAMQYNPEKIKLSIDLLRKLRKEIFDAVADEVKSKNGWSRAEFLSRLASGDREAGLVYSGVMSKLLKNSAMKDKQKQARQTFGYLEKMVRSLERVPDAFKSIGNSKYFPSNWTQDGAKKYATDAVASAGIAWAPFLLFADDDLKMSSLKWSVLFGFAMGIPEIGNSFSRLVLAMGETTVRPILKGVFHDMPGLALAIGTGRLDVALKEFTGDDREAFFENSADFARDIREQIPYFPTKIGGILRKMFNFQPLSDAEVELAARFSFQMDHPDIVMGRDEALQVATKLDDRNTVNLTNSQVRRYSGTKVKEVFDRFFLADERFCTSLKKFNDEFKSKKFKKFDEKTLEDFFDGKLEKYGGAGQKNIVAGYKNFEILGELGVSQLAIATAAFGTMLGLLAQLVGKAGSLPKAIKEWKNEQKAKAKRLPSEKKLKSKGVKEIRAVFEKERNPPKSSKIEFWRNEFDSAMSVLQKWKIIDSVQAKQLKSKNASFIHNFFKTFSGSTDSVFGKKSSWKPWDDSGLLSLGTVRENFKKKVNGSKLLKNWNPALSESKYFKLADQVKKLRNALEDTTVKTADAKNNKTIQKVSIPGFFDGKPLQNVRKARVSSYGVRGAGMREGFTFVGSDGGGNEKIVRIYPKKSTNLPEGFYVQWRDPRKNAGRWSEKKDLPNNFQFDLS